MATEDDLAEGPPVEAAAAPMETESATLDAAGGGAADDASDNCGENGVDGMEVEGDGSAAGSPPAAEETAEGGSEWGNSVVVEGADDLDAVGEDEEEGEVDERDERAVLFEELAPEDLVAIYKYVPKTVEGRKMILQEYEPGEHNPPGYKFGWLCDVCRYNSHENPSDVMSMFRWHCPKSESDLCRACARQQALEKEHGRKRRSAPMRVAVSSQPKIQLPKGQEISRAKSGYLFYRMEQQRLLTKQEPGIAFAECAARIGAAWRALTDDEAAPYHELARKDKFRLEQLALAQIEPPKCFAEVTTAYPSAVTLFAYPPRFEVVVEEKPAKRKMMSTRRTTGDDSDAEEDEDREWAPKPTRTPGTGRRGGAGGKRIWSDEEVEVYKTALGEHGRDYEKIADILGGAKTVAQVHSFWNNYKDKKYFLHRYLKEGAAPPPRKKPSGRQPKKVKPAGPPPCKYPPGTQLRDDVTGKPIPPSDNPLHYCSFCCTVDTAKNLLSCSKCSNSGRQHCLRYSDALWKRCKANPGWECIECKVCTICKKEGDDDKLLFCDDCDSAYHMFCLNPPVLAAPGDDDVWKCPDCIDLAVPATAPPAEEEEEEEDFDIGAEENEETDGQHKVIPGFYYDTVRQKYFPRTKKRKAGDVAAEDAASTAAACGAEPPLESAPKRLRTDDDMSGMAQVPAVGTTEAAASLSTPPIAVASVPPPAAPAQFLGGSIPPIPGMVPAADPVSTGTGPGTVPVAVEATMHGERTQAPPPFGQPQ